MRSACVITLLLLGAMSHCVVAFVVHPTFSSLRATNIALNALVELVPEPEGGEEIIALSTMSKNTKVKKMGDATSVKLKEGEGPAYQFWLTTEAEAALIQSIYNRVLKDAGKKANFPGFRKVSHHTCRDCEIHRGAVSLKSNLTKASCCFIAL